MLRDSGAQQNDIAHLTQQCVGCEERVDQLRRRQDMEREQSHEQLLRQARRLDEV